MEWRRIYSSAKNSEFLPTGATASVAQRAATLTALGHTKPTNRHSNLCRWSSLGINRVRGSWRGSAILRGWWNHKMRKRNMESVNRGRRSQLMDNSAIQVHYEKWSETGSIWFAYVVTAPVCTEWILMKNNYSTCSGDFEGEWRGKNSMNFIIFVTLFCWHGFIKIWHVGMIIQNLANKMVGGKSEQ